MIYVSTEVGSKEFEQPLRRLGLPVEKSQMKFGDRYASSHEFWGVLMEEVEEARDEIKGNKMVGARARLLHEVSQVASVCLKFMAGNFSDDELRDEAMRRGLL